MPAELSGVSLLRLLNDHRIGVHERLAALESQFSWRTMRGSAIAIEFAGWGREDEFESVRALDPDLYDCATGARVHGLVTGILKYRFEPSGGLCAALFVGRQWVAPLHEIRFQQFRVLGCRVEGTTTRPQFVPEEIVERFQERESAPSDSSTLSVGALENIVRRVTGGRIPSGLTWGVSIPTLGEPVPRHFDEAYQWIDESPLDDVYRQMEAPQEATASPSIVEPTPDAVQASPVDPMDPVEVEYIRLLNARSGVTWRTVFGDDRTDATRVRYRHPVARIVRDYDPFAEDDVAIYACYDRHGRMIRPSHEIVIGPCVVRPYPSVSGRAVSAYVDDSVSQAYRSFLRNVEPRDIDRLNALSGTWMYLDDGTRCRLRNPVNNGFEVGTGGCAYWVLFDRNGRHIAPRTVSTYHRNGVTLRPAGGWRAIRENLARRWPSANAVARTTAPVATPGEVPESDTWTPQSVARARELRDSRIRERAVTPRRSGRRRQQAPTLPAPESNTVALIQSDTMRFEPPVEINFANFWSRVLASPDGRDRSRIDSPTQGYGWEREVDRAKFNDLLSAVRPTEDVIAGNATAVAIYNDASNTTEYVLPMRAGNDWYGHRIECIRLSDAREMMLSPNRADIVVHTQFQVGTRTVFLTSENIGNHVRVWREISD